MREFGHVELMRRWSGWNSVRHKEIQAEPKPDLPLETSELSQYLIRIEDKEVVGPFGCLLPPRPLHEMFADAWAVRSLS
ncbi:hypothetical protein GFY24_04590 [Nocardia sp. SYP-A9097]|uniref:hypothetical protein n=1 Tax=Nocardia sp. SYP-A9097 TaxID=2663237 RepID=UPI00129AB5A0|nr:hypothetical protein [Nocardia sp. SYP-A9097]MRH86754.1 hypothetical protein [Nocardia sp. SYP-A9097]